MNNGIKIDIIFNQVKINVLKLFIKKARVKGDTYNLRTQVPLQ